MSETAGSKKIDQYYTRPEQLGKWESFHTFLWNSETSQFMGRTGSSWAKILLFYIIFYAVLVGFFAAMLAVFYQTLDDTKPKWILDRSLIGTNPGLGFRPMPPDTNVGSTLIRYKSADKGNVQYWQRELNKFLEVYQTKENNENIQDCTNMDSPDEGKACAFKINDNWRPCLKQTGYGFESDTTGPCIFLKLNKIFGWNPEYYNSSTIPEHMPQHLQEIIEDKERSNQHQIVWVDCAGESPADVEHIGSVMYYPERGFHKKYFPFMNIKGYVSPIVAVHFQGPKRGVLINIECKAWANNIHHDRAENRGSVHFELMID